MFDKKIICFDIGGTKILKAVVKIKSEKFEFLEIDEEKNPRKPEKIKEILSRYSRSSRKKFGTKKVAVSTADIVDPVKKTIRAQKINFGAEFFDLKFLEEEGFSVRVENDGRCFAWGEYFFGKGKGKKSILVLTLGTGIGGGFIADGKNLRGAHSSALEVGRSKIFYNNNLQMWEWIAAGRGIEKFYFDATKEKIASEEIFEKAKNGEKEAGKVLAQAEEVLGVGISNLLNILDPETVVFGGGMSRRNEFVRKAIAIAKKNVMNKKANYKFAISSLGNKANLLGAASLYLK
jgi:predicted NBD/HSP70 family sugar kinase